jgi:hypothetical protein
MHAPNDSGASSHAFLARHLVTSWDYRHPSALAAVRLAVGIGLVVLSVLLLSIGDWWAAPLLLVVAAAIFTAMFCVLRVVQGQAAPGPAGAQPSLARGHRP